MLSRKTMIMLSPDVHRRLTELAGQRRTGLGELVRSACERRYGLAGSESRVAAARALGEFSMPVGTVKEMKRECVPDADLPLP